MEENKQEIEELRDLITSMHREIEELKEQVAQQAPDQMLGVKEAAEFLNYSEASIYSMISRDEIPSHFHRGKRYFSRNELLEWRKSGSSPITSSRKKEALQEARDKRKKVKGQ